MHSFVEYHEALQNHPAIIGLATVFVKFLSDASESPRTFDFMSKAEAERKLMVLSVRGVPFKINESEMQTMESFLRFCIGRCESCFICRNPAALTTLGSRYRVPKNLRVLETDLCCVPMDTPSDADILSDA